MASLSLRFWWWFLTVLVLIFTFFGGAFSSSWANQFEASRNKCNGYNTYFIQATIRDPNFKPSVLFLILAVISEISSLVISKEIDKQNKENDEIYRIGIEAVKKERLSLEYENTSKELDIEKIKREIEKVKREIS
jgi:hypothetical protein